MKLNLKISSWKGAMATMLLLLFMPLNTLRASNASEARGLFNNAWHLFTSPNGCSLGYSVNIIGLYKTAGTIWVKGKRQHYQEKRYCGWSGPKYFYKVDLKKRTVDFHNPNSAKRDKYLSKFTFSPNDYNFSWANSKEGLIITMEGKDGIKSSIKHAKLVLDRHTHYPIAVKVRVAFFWTTVKISNFHPGISNDDIFDYPAARFKGFKFTNHWPE